jgi:uncharacterized membrane protein
VAVIWAAMAFFALQASCEGLSTVFGDPRGMDPMFRDKYVAHLALVRLHGVAGATALCLGLLPFLRWTLRLKAHARLGRLYGLSVVVAGLTALPMALMAEGGPLSRLAFLGLALCWLATIAVAIAAARNRRWALHRRFMVRNYALTYSAVLSRLLLNGLQAEGWMRFEDIYPVISWTWLLGLAVGEWWLWYSQRHLKVR